MIALTDGDIVIGRATGVVGPVIPLGLLSHQDGELRFDGDAVILLDDEPRAYWVDGIGRKHISAIAGSSELICRASDALVREGGAWRVETLEDRLTSYARDVRWRREIGGMSWNGVPIATDDSSKVKIAGARIAAQADPTFETTWYGADGEGVVVDAALIIQLSDAVLAHVDGTFTTFGQVKAAITAGSITTQEQVDQAFD